MIDNSTIVAIATANGIGSISIVRVSGEQALEIAKKVSKKAVTRNTLRRRVSALVEESFNSITSPTKAIILIRRDFSATTPADLKKEVQTLLAKVMV